MAASPRLRLCALSGGGGAAAPPSLSESGHREWIHRSPRCNPVSFSLPLSGSVVRHGEHGKPPLQLQPHVKTPLWNLCGSRRFKWILKSLFHVWEHTSVWISVHIWKRGKCPLSLSLSLVSKGSDSTYLRRLGLSHRRSLPRWSVILWL